MLQIGTMKNIQVIIFFLHQEFIENPPGEDRPGSRNSLFFPLDDEKRQK